MVVFGLEQAVISLQIGIKLVKLVIVISNTVFVIYFMIFLKDIYLKAKKLFETVTTYGAYEMIILGTWILEHHSHTFMLSILPN